MPLWQTTQDTPEENNRCTLYWCDEPRLMAANVSTSFERIIMDKFAGSNIGFCPLERLARTSTELFYITSTLGVLQEVSEVFSECLRNSICQLILVYSPKLLIYAIGNRKICLTSIKSMSPWSHHQPRQGFRETRTVLVQATIMLPERERSCWGSSSSIASKSSNEGQYC